MPSIYPDQNPAIIAFIFSDTAMSHIQQFLALIRNAVRRHGGGLAGVKSVVTRSIKVTRAMGISGLIRRMHAAHRRDFVQVEVPIDALILAPPVPVERIGLKLGVMAHIFYADLIEEFAIALSHMPAPYSLLVSVMDEEARRLATTRFCTLPFLQDLHVRIVANRGRDIAPLLITFRQEILQLDLVCHIHTKKSLYTGEDQIGWRSYLLTSLMGTEQRIAWIVGTFASTPDLGIVFPESFRTVPLWAHTWLSNAEWGRQIGQLIGLDIDTSSYLDFPAGSMFWARVQALKPLLDLNLDSAAFPEENAQIEGTLHHAIERMFGLVTLQQGLRIGVLPANQALRLTSEGERNRSIHFDTSLTDRVDYFSIGAKLVSFDIFDTLVMRAFLEPQGARAYLAHRVKQQFNLDGFAQQRTNAETRARARLKRDPNLTEIYAEYAQMADFPLETVHRLRAFELEFERSILKPRQATLNTLKSAQARALDVVALSDMYLTADDLRSILPKDIVESLPDIQVSCDIATRKDDPATWLTLSKKFSTDVSDWLHVGDNENADVYRPLSAKLKSAVHVLRPAALFWAVPGLRGLRPQSIQRSRWEDQLWLGLVANRFTDIGDARPHLLAQQVMIDEPELLGYTVLGPLLIDYLAWLARLALERGANKILFLSREGYLLHRLYSDLQHVSQALAGVEGVYLFASRRGVSTPTIFAVDDMLAALKKPYTGTLVDLLNARFGQGTTDAVRDVLGTSALQQEVYLPDMAERIVSQLKVAQDGICAIAQNERLAYLDYWSSRIAHDDRLIVADIGYSGSIQMHLSRLTGCTLGGAYFAVDAQIEQIETNDGWAAARYYDARKDDESQSPVMHYHLFLESILTSPDGQFSHFETTSVAPIFKTESDHSSRWPLIERIHQGAMQFAHDVRAVVQADWLSLSFDKRLVQEPLRCVGNGTWQMGDWSQRLGVEDHYSGRGKISKLAVTPRSPEIRP